MSNGVLYSREIAEKILDLLEQGHSLRQIVRMEGMPTRRSFAAWRAEHEWLATEYDIVTEEACRDLLEETREIADDGRNDWMEVQGRNGTYIQLNTEAVQRSKLRCWQREMEAKRKRPDLFSDGLTLRGDKANPLQTETRSTLTDAELERIAIAGRKHADG